MKILRVGLLILAGLFIAVAILVYWYKSTPLEKQATQVGVTYRIDIPRGVWVDTGVWVAPNYEVMAGVNNGQPFYLAVDSTTEKASFVPGVPGVFGAETDGFFAKIWTFDKSLPDGFLDGGLVTVKTAWVESEAKIYLYADRPVSVIFLKERIPPQTIGAMNAKAEQQRKGVTTRNLISAVLGFAFVLFMFIGILFARKK